MAIRPAQVTDLPRIDQLYQEGLQLSLQGEGATSPIRLWQIVSRTLSSLLPMMTPSEMLYVLEEDGRVMGFIQAERVSGRDSRVPSRTPAPGEAIRVLNLSLALELVGGGGALIDHLCNEALQRGVGRVYVRLPEGHPGLETFRAHDFQVYATERVFYRSDLFGLRGDFSAPGLRAARRDDTLGLYTLYLAATPQQVSQFEAPDLDHWRALYAERLGHYARRPARSLVLERGELDGWLGVEPAHPGRPHTLAMLARPDAGVRGEVQKQLLSEAARQLEGHPGAAWCNVRSYDTATQRVLQDALFEVLTGQELMVREMRVREKAPARAKKEKAMTPAFG